MTQLALLIQIASIWLMEQMHVAVLENASLTVLSVWMRQAVHLEPTATAYSMWEQESVLAQPVTLIARTVMRAQINALIVEHHHLDVSLIVFLNFVCRKEHQQWSQLQMLSHQHLSL